MKTTMRFALAAALVAALVMSGYAKDQSEGSFNREAAENNLLVGIASDNYGLRVSAASILGDVGSARSVVPLMRMLHDGDEGERIVAALALSRIGDGRGVFAVKQAAQFDPSQKVQRLAAWYYNEYAIPKPTENPVKEAVAALQEEIPAPLTESLDGFDEYQGSASAWTGY